MNPPRTGSYSSTTPVALPPSCSRSNKGCLSVAVWSANDLFSCQQQQQPISVSLKVAGATVQSGPPSARHKNSNSYRFDSNKILRVDAPLPTLYKSTALLTLEYPNSRDNRTATLECKSLSIHHTTSLTLKLTRNVPPEVTTSSITTSDDDVAPTLQVQVRLEGPYRTEVQAILNLTRAWFQVVDTVQDALSPLFQQLPSPNYLLVLLIPSVPLLATVAVVSPVVIGISILFLPIVLPLLILMGMIVLTWMTIAGVLLASTRMGRNKIATTLAAATPVYSTLFTPPVQTMLYDTGTTRLTPVTTLAQYYLPTDLVGKLCVSLVMDTVGSSSYLLPMIGESFDLLWCPCQTILVKAMYSTTSPNLTYVSFAEEFLPFTDVLPTATIGWITEFGPELLEMAKEGIMRTSNKWSSTCRSSEVVGCK